MYSTLHIFFSLQVCNNTGVNTLDSVWKQGPSTTCCTFCTLRTPCTNTDIHKTNISVNATYNEDDNGASESIYPMFSMPNPTLKHLQWPFLQSGNASILFIILRHNNTRTILSNKIVWTNVLVVNLAVGDFAISTWPSSWVFTQIWFGRGCTAGDSNPIPISRGNFSKNRYPFLRIFPK